MHKVLEMTENFIKEFYPMCSLMPATKKGAAYGHKGQSCEVRWSKWDTKGRSQCLTDPTCSTLVLLYGPTPEPPYGGEKPVGALGAMIVIDVDDEDLAKELEGLFPAIGDTAIQQTRHGRHYFFRRSALCEEMKVTDKAGIVHYPPRSAGNTSMEPYKIDIKTGLHRSGAFAQQDLAARSVGPPSHRHPRRLPPLPVELPHRLQQGCQVVVQAHGR